MLIRNRHAIGGAAGLLLLGLAFAWRWLGVPLDGIQPEAPAAAPVAIVQAPVVASPVPAAEPGQAPMPDTPAASEDPAPGEGLDVDAQRRVDDALASAAAAAAAGRLIAPAGDSALAWYDKALAIAPRDRAARSGRADVVQRAVALAHAMIDRGELADADAQIALLTPLDTARDAIEALQARRAAQPQVEELLRQGAQRMAAGQRFEPDGTSALDSYRQALQLDSRSMVAQQGVAEIEAAVLERALAAASEDRFEDADRLLGRAAEIRQGTGEQLATRGRVLELKRSRAEGMFAAAEAALDARNPSAAESLIARAAALVPDDARLDTLRRRMADARIYDNLQPGDIVTDSFIDRDGAAPALVVVPVGSFELGSPAGERGRREHEGPQHRVDMQRAFAIGRTEVSVAEFARFVRAAGYVTSAEQTGNSSVYDEKTGRISDARAVTWRNDYLGALAADNAPVLHVSFDDASAYVAWLGERTGKPYRLPSEAEFEYVLRAGTRTRFWWGNGNPLRVVGNYTGDGDRSRTGRSWTKAFPRYSDGFFGPAPVASFPANAFGVHDMNGNVSEWVEDCWHDSYLRAPADGTAWVNRGCERRVVRGGSWGSASDQFRSAYRTGSPPAVRSARIGFRVARDL